MAQLTDSGWKTQKRPRDHKKFVSPSQMAKMLRKLARAIADNKNPGVKVHCYVRVRMFQEHVRG